MAEAKIYRTYRFRTKDPVIDELRTLVQDEGLIKKLHLVHVLSGVSTSTLDNWFNGDTVSPQNRTICAVTSALGYARRWEKQGDFDMANELKIAAEWNKKEERRRLKEAEKATKPKKKLNGHGHRAEARA